MAAILSFHPEQAPAPTPPPVAVIRPHRRSAEVYRRRRLAVVAVFVGLVMGLLSLGRSADAIRTPEAESADSITYVVQPGDTLWGIARDLAPGDDPRPLVDALDDIAGGSLLQPGQRLVVPGHLVG